MTTLSDPMGPARIRRRRESPRKVHWVPAAAFMMRAPALPIESFRSLSSWRECDRASHTDPVDALGRDPYVGLALSIASPAMARVTSAREHGETPPELLRPLLSYLIRMSTRPTPFGLFAGVAWGEWGSRTEVSFSGPPSRWYARPDMAWLNKLVDRMDRDPAIRARVCVETNPGVRVRGGRVWLDEARSESGPRHVSIRATAVVREVLERCRRAVGYATLVETLCAGGRRQADATRVIDTLCDHGLLITDLRSSLTGAPAQTLSRRLTTIPAAQTTARALGGLLADVAAWQDLPVADAYRSWEGLNETARALEGTVPSFQVDCGFADSVKVSRAVAHEVAHAVRLLFRLSPLPHGLPALAAWRGQFEDTYGPDRSVPLLDLVDRGLPELHAEVARVRHRDRLLLGLVGDALQSGQRQIQLDEVWIARLERGSGGPGRPPRSVELCCSIAASSEEAVDSGQFLLVVTGAAAVTPAGRSFGRFAHVLGERCSDLLATMSTVEPGGPVTAEMLFEPHHVRSANVMIRPIVPKYVIPLNGRVGDGQATVIPLSDLSVVLSAGRLRLMWSSQGVEVTASCLHMLSFRFAPALAHFLHAVSHDGETVLDQFSWGAAEYLPFRPRLQVGKVVLRPAEWSLARSFLDAFCRDPGAALGERGLPRYVQLGTGDERLLLDLHSERGGALLLAAGRKLTGGQRMQVREALPGPDDAFASGRDGHRLVELVVPTRLAGDDGREEVRQKYRHRPVTPAQRLRPPGSDWLYAKLYTSPDLADDIIGGPLLRLIQRLSARSISTWHFVRYVDPSFHLRVRLGGDLGLVSGPVLSMVCAWARELVDAGTLTRFALDTYERETERYGGPEGLALAEQLFAADSEAVARLLSPSCLRACPLDRTHLAVLTVDDLLDGLGFDQLTRLEWYRRQRASAPHPTGFSSRKQELRRLLGPPAASDGADGLESVRAILAARRPVVREVGHALVELEQRDALWADRSDIARSFVHMHCNRLCVAAGTEEDVLDLAGLTAASLVAWPPVRAN